MALMSCPGSLFISSVPRGLWWTHKNHFSSCKKWLSRLHHHLSHSPPGPDPGASLNVQAEGVPLHTLP